MVSGDEIIEDGGDHRHPQEEVPHHAWPSQAVRGPVYNKGGREVGRPYAYRDDVGAVGILTGNWGGHRANAATQAAMDLDLKSGPATIICLQEAHEGVAGVLGGPVDPPPPAVAGTGVGDRPQAQYYTLRAKENCNTNFIVVRVNLASELKIGEVSAHRGRVLQGEERRARRGEKPDADCASDSDNQWQG